jgi:hypothetical protein
MAKKKTGPKNMPAIEETKVVRHARIELSDDDYQRLKEAAKRLRISMSAYIRMTVMKQVDQDVPKESGQK